MKTAIPLLAALIVGLPLSTDANAAWPNSFVPSTISPDVLYDYKVYAAAPGPNIRYFLLISYPDGTSRESGPYQLERDAYYALWMMYEREQVTEGTHISVFSRDVGPIWQFIGTYPTRAAAMSVTDILESIGWQTQIVPVNVFAVERPPTGPVLSAVR